MLSCPIVGEGSPPEAFNYQSNGRRNASRYKFICKAVDVKAFWADADLRNALHVYNAVVQ